MTLTRLVLAFAAVALPLHSAPGSAEARTITAEYSVKIRGFLVGRAEFQADISGKRYTMRFSAGVQGLGRISSDAETTATVGGKLGADRLLPSEYNHAWTEDGETETVEMRFSGRAVTTIDLEPPRNHPERYVTVHQGKQFGRPRSRQRVPLAGQEDHRRHLQSHLAARRRAAALRHHVEFHPLRQLRHAGPVLFEPGRGVRAPLHGGCGTADRQAR